jgi:hypothetical protein
MSTGVSALARFHDVANAYTEEILSSKQMTHAYLLALALGNQAIVPTFDSKIVAFPRSSPTEKSGAKILRKLGPEGPRMDFQGTKRQAVALPSWLNPSSKAFHLTFLLLRP